MWLPPFDRATALAIWRGEINFVLYSRVSYFDPVMQERQFEEIAARFGFMQEPGTDGYKSMGLLGIEWTALPRFHFDGDEVKT